MRWNTFPAWDCNRVGKISFVTAGLSSKRISPRGYWRHWVFFPCSSKNIVTKESFFSTMFFVFSFLAVTPGLYFRPHYFVLLLPAAALLTGVSFDVLSDITGGSRRRIIRYGIPVVVVMTVLVSSGYVQRTFLFKMSPFQVSRKIYRLNPFPESLVIADYIRRNSEPDNRIAVLGSEPQIYFYAQRRAAGSYIYMYPLMENHRFAYEMQKEMIRQIEQKEPKFLVLVNISTSWLFRKESQRLILNWVQGYLSNYRLVGMCEITPVATHFSWYPKVNMKPQSSKWVGIYQRKPEVNPVE